ncbi:MAG TPA: FG-GAP-like repeat-containing protein [Candidatus Eisenbacteria bacterium]|nr:FG-GAP-like repeat-containing protein [Candidatus Eisenbacteria bacterium]
MRFRALRFVSIALAVAFAAHLGAESIVSRALAAEPVPPVPMKKGAVAPQEGFSRNPKGAPVFIPGTSIPRAPLASRATHDILAIRVAFSDTPIDSSTAYYDRLLFFMNQYWSQATGGLHVLNATLVDSVFTLPQPMSYYGDDSRFQERLVFLVRDLVAVADPVVDFRNKELILFHAGLGQEADVLDNSREQIWSAFVTPEDFETILPDPSGLPGIPTNDEISPGVPWRVKEVTELPEAESQDGYIFGMTGVTCHEYGHQLGLPDLYDTTSDVNGNNQGLAGWDIMAGGVWNGNGFVPAYPSAWSRQWIGALAPQRLLSDGSLSLGRLSPPVAGFQRSMLIPQTQSEYLLLENRDQDPNGNGKFDWDDTNADGLFDFYTDSYDGAEFDFYLPGEGTGSGMTIYHVDDSKVVAGLASNTVNGDTQRKGVDIVEADGIQDLDQPPTDLTSGSPNDVFRAGGRDALTPDTNPSTDAYGPLRSGISITNIGAADSVMTFDVAFERNRSGFPKLLNGRLIVGPTLAADFDGDGIAELFVPTRRTNNPGDLFVFEPNGTDYLDGDATPTPFAAVPSPLTGSVVVGDIDGVAGNEVVFQTLNGAIYAFHADGSEVADGDNNPGTVGVLTGGGGLPTHGQPILVDLDLVPGMEIVVGTSASPIGGSTLIAVKVSGGVVSTYTIPMCGSTEAPPAAADLNGDGFPEVVVANAQSAPGDIAELNRSGISVVNWETFTDPELLRDADLAPQYLAKSAGNYGPPTLVNLDRSADGTYEALMADKFGAFHAFHFDLATHIPGTYPNEYVTSHEMTGWPQTLTSIGRATEVSAADLEGDGYPELFQTGEDCRVASFHWNGAPRSGFPVKAGDPLAPADSAGLWAPYVADVDNDGKLDVIAILPDGRRLAYHSDGSPVPSFGELGSTGLSAPPILADLDGDGLAEWVETFDLSNQCAVVVRNTAIPVRPATGNSVGSLAWNQWRTGATRNAAIDLQGTVAPSGTQILSEVYAYPNPASGGTTTIHYRLSGPADQVKVSIYDPSGAIVAEPPVGDADRAGSAEHAVLWNHAAMSSGVYVCRVEVSSPSGTEVKLTRLAVLR